VEAWARRERYRALADMARAAGCSMVLLAHHRRDQAETFLLQALRGGGSAGLAAMPRSAQRDGVLWLRPWLEQPRSSIEAYLHRHRLTFIDDGSNADTRFARNRLRLEVWSKLTAAFADAETSLVGAARLAQEAAECLHELAAIDLAACVQAGNLQVSAWSALTLARRKNLLRAWLVAVVAGPLPDTLVQRLALELPAARIGRWPAPGGELRLFDGLLRFATAAPAIPICPHPTQLDISRPGRYVLPGWGGKLDIEAVAHGGVATAELRHVELRPRKGGERFQFTPKSLPRDLKRQYQARRVPDWQRDGPLLYSRESLLFVPGLGIDARRLAADGTPQLRLVWQPDGAAAD
jgi:tRNA(Ile)-lysidine synthase